MTREKSNIPVELGKKYIVDITGMGHSGEGVARFKDFTIFIPYAIEGENVEIQIAEVKKNYAKANLLNVMRPAGERIQPRCPIYYECGGCQLQHLTCEGQLAFKRQKVVDAVTRIGKLDKVVVHPTLGAQSPWYYRNKMQFPIGIKDGCPVIGCFAAGTHEIINTENCFIQDEINNVIARAVRDIAAKLGISVYDERTGRGILRHVLGRVGRRTGEVMAVLVTTSNEIPYEKLIIEHLRSKIPGLVSIVQNINPRRTNVILGEHTKLLWGKDTITDKLGDLSFNISAKSFFQVNTEQSEMLYNKTLEYCGLQGHETVVDAYCGTGTITLFLAKRAKKVYGTEIVPAAIKDAWLNAQNNGVENVEFIQGDAVDVMPKMYAQGIRPDVIVVDPPRAGCDKKVLETFHAMNPQRIVYVSCNPSSLARDLAILAELGFSVKEIQPVDMFPQTYHVECVALIERK
ncbi:MAG: 23S rRNA (uracil(1939)-C(5))-methyltransferase RlmD [Clostridia bacterium]|nr:23S rRNA (uracil(1939)-C(5))-methyltransferase RlmD [Clostridia bacterium]